MMVLAVNNNFFYRASFLTMETENGTEVLDFLLELTRFVTDFIICKIFLLMRMFCSRFVFSVRVVLETVYNFVLSRSLGVKLGC
jgi:hypothetical protein